MEDINLREVKTEDFKFLYNLHREALMPYIDLTWGWEEEWQLDYFRESFDPGTRKIIQCKGEDIGCISVQDQKDALFIAYIAILPIYQSRGIGSHLIREVIWEAENRNIPVRIHTLKVNPVLELYERLGFQITGSTETHLLMER
jgi:ribosomal protein S18 acetylase RimI-like enzyme